MKHLTNALNGLNHWWRYLILFLISFFGGQLLGGIPLIFMIILKTIQSGGELAPNPENMSDLSVYGIDPNLGFVLMMFPFLVSLAVLFLLIKPLHKRSFKTLFSGTLSIRWERFFTAALVWFGLMGVSLITDYSINPENFTFNFDLTSFLILTVISLVLIPFQASYEEILFRGYLAQGVAAWTKNRLMVILLPAFIFGLMHIINPEIKKFGFWLVMPQYILFGVIFGLTTVLDDGIELAMGAHTANNIFLSLFVTTKASALQTPALLMQDNIDPAKDLLIMVLVSIVFIAIVSKLYNFDYSILGKKVVVKSSEEQQANFIGT